MNSTGWMDELERRLAGRPLREPEPSPGSRRAGVLVPLFVRDAMLWVVFTRRTETVEHVAVQCSTAGWGCVDCKKVLAESMETELVPIRSRAAELRAEPALVQSALAQRRIWSGGEG